MRIAVVGDSNTEGDSPNFAAGEIGSGSWVGRLLSLEGFAFAGGWADGGTTSATQAANLTQLPAASVDTLLVMTGTNDVAQRQAWSVTQQSIETIVSKAGASRVVLLAIPPSDVDPTDSRAHNERLSALAAERGWDYFDGLGFLRTSDNRYVDGATADGVHLTFEAQQEFGDAVAAFLRG